MKETEVRDKIFELEQEMYRLSDAISKGLEKDGLDGQYLAGKVQGLINVSNHVKEQLEWHTT